MPASEIGSNQMPASDKGAIQVPATETGADHVPATTATETGAIRCQHLKQAQIRYKQLQPVQAPKTGANQI